MLFFSFEFLYLFLPITVLVFYAMVRLSNANLKLCMLWLIGASLVFYGYWNPAYLLLIGGSMVFNYFAGRYLFEHKNRLALVAAVGFNIGLISYYKYLGFFADTLNAIGGTNFQVSEVVLPLAISFFTFQQIAWVVDNYRGSVSEGKVSFGEYILFVSFFPQLIAGPIVHHSEIIPQFRDKRTLNFQWDNVSTGIAIFIIGLFKKVVIADNISPTVSIILDGAAWGATYGFVDTWVALVAFPMQVYFDFSGYADMAIGLALLFNIRLPINFESPHKSFNMTEYWRRWHMTLGRFLRSYLYIPLGGNRKGEVRTYINMVLTLLLGGLWHGAGWTFVIWGGMHGLLQVIGQLWSRYSPLRLPAALAWFLTFVGTTIAHSFFGAHDLDSALRVLSVMFLLNDSVAQSANIPWHSYTLIGVTFIGLLVLPSTRQLMSERFTPIQFDKNTVSADVAIQVPWLDNLKMRWTLPWLAYLTVLAGLTLYTLLDATTVQEFIYFQF
jgi:alginate O-acetyltransferase complex protein AlgI